MEVLQAALLTIEGYLDIILKKYFQKCDTAIYSAFEALNIQSYSRVDEAKLYNFSYETNKLIFISK